MRKRDARSDRNDQQGESADEQDVKEVHSISGSYRDQPHGENNKPVRRPYAPGERRPHGRKPPGLHRGQDYGARGGSTHEC